MVLFFDVGYTLVDESRAWARRCEEQARGGKARALGLSAESLREALYSLARTEHAPYAAMLARYGLRERAPYRPELETLDPDAPRVLRALGERYRLGVIANQQRGLTERLASMGILEYFEWVISSADCGAAKPDPRIFRLALERAGCAPRDAVMIGDRLDNDIAPAKSLGMRTVWVRQGFGGLPRPRFAAETPDIQVDSLAGLLPIFAIDPIK